MYSSLLHAASSSVSESTSALKSGASKWTTVPGADGLVNVAASKRDDAFLRESPGNNCTVGNTAQLGIAGRGDIVTVYQEATGTLFEVACGGAAGGGLCLGVAGSAIQLMECTRPEARGWRRVSSGHLADPLEVHS
eukprot:COSAG05_NODE_1604_length_4427_cov_5.080869_4_plen_136_part_00